LEEQERERLYQQAQSGGRKQVVLEELDKFLESRQKALAGAMVNAKTPDEAYMVSCQCRALASFIGEAKAAISIGEKATQELLATPS
jgi:hypothetical protein